VELRKLRKSVPSFAGTSAPPTARAGGRYAGCSGIGRTAASSLRGADRLGQVSPLSGGVTITPCGVRDPREPSRRG